MSKCKFQEEINNKYYDIGEDDYDNLYKGGPFPAATTRRGRIVRFLSILSCAALFGFVLYLLGLILLASHSHEKPYQKKYYVLKVLVKDFASHEPPSKVISCYYNFPSEHGTDELMPTDINPNLCTHINIAFARVANNEIKLEDYQFKSLLEIVKLKRTNPDLKILLSVGGAKNDDGFPNMVLNHNSRKTFIKSIKNVLRNYSLDGIDLDWEFPALHKAEDGGRERQHFSQLLREIRMEYIREKRDYLLTIAAAAPQTIVDVSYDVDQLNEYVDFVNIMTYDYHYYTKYTPFTGFNSPLYQRSTEQMYLATLNINYTVHMYMTKGLDRKKIVVGIPTYGHTFALVNANNHQVNSPASGFGSLGSQGFVNYPDVCTFITNSSNCNIMEDSEAKVPYLYSNKEWVSYENHKSVMEKAKFIVENQLGGAMIYSLNADDYEGVCGTGGGVFPLAETVSNTLKNWKSSSEGDFYELAVSRQWLDNPTPHQH